MVYAGVTLIIVLAITMVLLVVNALTKTTPTVEVTALCKTTDCLSHASLVVLKINRGLSPCNDFGAYACSGWEPINHYSIDVFQDMKYRWIEKLAAVLAANASVLPPMMKASAMYAACIDRGLENETKSLYDLKHFMEGRRIPWPQVVSGADPLDVLLDMTINWLLPFWFDIQLLHGVTSYGRVIYITPGLYTKFWSVQKRSLESGDSYEEYCEGFLKLFTLNETKGSCDKKTIGIDGDIFDRLNEVARSTKIKPNYFRLKSMSTYTPSISTSQWVSLLNKHLRPSKEISEFDMVLVSDETLLSSVNYVLEKNNKEDILRNLGWRFVQIYSNVAVWEAYMLKYGSSQDAARFAPLSCQVQVEDVYK